MNILLVANLAKENIKELASKVTEYLLTKNVSVRTTLEDSDKPVDLIISLGGDGHILRIIHNYPTVQAPIMGINLGSLGFLADIPVDGTYQAIDEVLKGNYQIQKRLMLEGHIAQNGSCLAVNEMVVHRGKNHCLVDFAIQVDGKYLNTFSADGVIVATPSGSTAYSLSAGGPILTPELDAVVITPVCPHAMSNRPIVIKMPATIEIRNLCSSEDVEVAFDGCARFSLKTDEAFTIKRAKREFNLVMLPGTDYFATLRTKLGWTGSLRPK
jgi:NAD+ kinase